MTTSDNRARLEQGGITPHPDENSVPLTAAEYSHSSIPGRTVVRLVREPLLAAEGLTLGVSGLSPQGRLPVGHTRRRAIGFPAWPILNDPANAQHALNLVADLERAARLARSKPGRAKDAITALADTLDASAPHFLPTFLEEAARIFLSVENTSYAAQMFAKAREAERRHSLPVDEERHHEVMMEFAYAGAISAKELSVEAKNLAERLDPAKAYETFRTLCVERVRGGLTPYAAMKKDLAKLAKAAGLKPTEEEVGVASDLLRASSIERASESFWNSYDTAIRKAVASDEALRAHLLTLSPEEAGIDEWLQLLVDTGATELVKDGTHPEFVPHIVEFASRSSWRTESREKLVPLLADILPHAGCTSISRYSVHTVPAAALEQLLAHNVSIELPKERYTGYVAIGSWARSANRAPLPHLVADADMRERVLDGIRNILGFPETVAVVATDPHLHPLVIELITEQVELLESAPPSADRLTEVTQFARHFESVDDAEVQALLARVRAYHGDLAEVLAETLRRGMLDELGWHEFDTAYADLQSGDADRAIDTQECWPGVILHNHGQSTYVRGRTTKDILNWTGDRPICVLEADGEFAIVHYDSASYTSRISWSGSKEPLESKVHDCWTGGMATSVPVPGGRLIGKDAVIRPGQPGWGPGTEQFFVEEDRVWMVTGGRSVSASVVEIDPDTGAKGRESMPDWFEAQRRRHPDLVFDPDRSQLRPVCAETAESAFSTAGGYHRHAVFTRPEDPDFCLVVDADGTDYTLTGEHASAICGVVRLPGGLHRLLAVHGSRTFIVDPSDSMPTLHHGVQFETAMWWHHTYSRDPELSTRLRKITADELRPVIERIAAHTATDMNGVNDVDDEMRETVSDLLGSPNDAVSCAVAKHALALVKSWPQSDTEPAPPALPEAPTMQEHRNVLAPVANYNSADFDGRDVWRSAAALGLHDRRVPDEAAYRGRESATDWRSLLGNGDALLALAAVPGRTAEEIQGLKEYWTILRDAGVLEASHLTVDALRIPDAMGSYWIDFPPGIIRADSHYGWNATVVRGDGGGPITINGHTLELLHRMEIRPSRTDLEPVFDALIARIESDGVQPWSPEPGEAFAAATGAPLADAHLVMAGFPNFHDYSANFLPADLRTAMGLKVAEASAAKDRLNLYSEHYAGVLAAGVPEDASALVDSGLDVQAMAAYWSEHGPAPTPQLPAKIAARKPKTLAEAPLQRVLGGEHAEGRWAGEVTALLWLACELDMADPMRASLADYAEELEKDPTGLDDVSLGGFDFSDDVGARLGLSSSEWTDTKTRMLEQSRFWINKSSWFDEVYVDLSAITDVEDPDLRLAQEWGAAGEGDTQTLGAVALRLTGALPAYAQWLREPGEGAPHDPLAVVPQLVADVAVELGVTEDAARYYLQLLAWPDPTDANVRHWNGWKKRDITRAGAELVQAGVVVEAKRPRAGRGFFLQGGWSEGEAPYLPIETWKVDSFGMTTFASRSKLRPLLDVAVAPEPPAQWFATCWERSRGDDAPQFAELETTRRKR